MARKKKEPEQNKKKINTDGVVGLVGSTTEQAITNSQSLPKLMSIESVMPSNISSSVIPFSCL